jgi:hypothetical protein
VGLRTLKIKNYANHVKEFLNRVKLLHPRYKTTQSSTGRSSDKNNRSDGPKPLIGFAIICFIGLILIIGLYEVFNNGATSNNTNSGYKVFENDLVKFNYASNLTAVDNSNATSVTVDLYDGSTSDPNNEVGTISSGLTNRTAATAAYSDWQPTTISGYDAIAGYDQQDAGAIIFISDQEGLDIIFDPGYPSAAKTTVNSFVIKKAPSEM